jgi:hypothetical protein
MPAFSQTNHARGRSVFAGVELLIRELEYKIQPIASQTGMPDKCAISRSAQGNAMMASITATPTASETTTPPGGETNGAQASTLLDTVRALQIRSAHLEEVAATMRQELAQIVEQVAHTPLVIYYIDNEKYEITPADIEAVRRRLIKPRTDEALRELALIEQMAKRQEHLPREEVARRLMETVDAIRAEAIADGTAIDREEEAALND